jgi:threonine synthase
MKSRLSLVCSRCGYFFQAGHEKSSCERCGGQLEYVFDEEYLKRVKFAGELRFWRYRPIMPPVQKVVSLGEGGTPIQRSQRLAESLGLIDLRLKDETRNPTSSFKDRSAALLISDALSKGFDSAVCATDGNHGASVAAYTAKANISSHLVVPKSMDLGKLAQMMAYDADIIEAGDTVEEAVKRARGLEHEKGWYQATTELNPLSIEGLKTISYELAEQDVFPDWLVVAMGSGATIHSLWKGYRELEVMGLVKNTPHLIGVQAVGCKPIAEAFEQGLEEPVEITQGETEALAINVAEPFFGELALRALHESGGFAVTVTDEEMIKAGGEIARLEGIFPEPASASTVACLKSLVEAGKIGKQDCVVSLITSSGLKTDDILRSLTKRIKTPGLGSKLSTKKKILSIILTSGKTYGYEIWKGMGREMTIGAIYQHLTDLEGRGLISSIMQGKRRYIEITEKGRRVLSALDDLQILL